MEIRRASVTYVDQNSLVNSIIFPDGCQSSSFIIYSRLQMVKVILILMKQLLYITWSVHPQQDQGIYLDIIYFS